MEIRLYDEEVVDLPCSLVWDKLWFLSLALPMKVMMWDRFITLVHRYCSGVGGLRLPMSVVICSLVFISMEKKD
ncbi:MAG: hypothetical protein SVY53_11450 [Chloroflexota bacterium]|nr:hypothetical protein [Chloroflexota bacterium]